ncbi:hypothetical protein R3P38DRAFT_3269311 [Favolaschia claudopus]|uniref:Uncharacterized protein n=1 Tax=Favolaschia claudopus TaxID=2862362 RepID=A0AAW0BK02_9AGAR
MFSPVLPHLSLFTTPPVALQPSSRFYTFEIPRWLSSSTPRASIPQPPRPPPSSDVSVSIGIHDARDCRARMFPLSSNPRLPRMLESRVSSTSLELLLG